MFSGSNRWFSFGMPIALKIYILNLKKKQFFSVPVAMTFHANISAVIRRKFQAYAYMSDHPNQTQRDRDNVFGLFLSRRILHPLPLLSLLLHLPTFVQEAKKGDWLRKPRRWRRQRRSLELCNVRQEWWSRSSRHRLARWEFDFEVNLQAVAIRELHSLIWSLRWARITYHISKVRSHKNVSL